MIKVFYVPVLSNTAEPIWSILSSDAMNKMQRKVSIRGTLGLFIVSSHCKLHHLKSLICSKLPYMYNCTCRLSFLLRLRLLLDKIMYIKINTWITVSGNQFWYKLHVVVHTFHWSHMSCCKSILKIWHNF